MSSNQVLANNNKTQQNHITYTYHDYSSIMDISLFQKVIREKEKD